MTDSFGDPGTGRDPFGDPGGTVREYAPAESRAQVPLDQWNRYRIPMEDGTQPAVNKGRLRVSTIAKSGQDTTQLQDNTERKIIEGIGKHPELAQQAAAAFAMEEGKARRAALRALAARAYDLAGGNDRRDRGTQFHELIDALHRDPATVVPEHLQPDVDAYFAALAEHQFQVIPELMEQIVICPYGAGGAFDNIMRWWNTDTEEYELLVVDTKTGRDLDYSTVSILIQLWEYANAYYMYQVEGLDRDDKGRLIAVRGHLEPMPLELRRDKAAVIHVRLDGTAEIHILDLSGVERYAAAAVELKRAAKEGGRKWRSLGVTRPAAFQAPALQQESYALAPPVVQQEKTVLDQALQQVAAERLTAELKVTEASTAELERRFPTPDQQAQADKAAERLAVVDQMAKEAGRNDDTDDEPPIDHVREFRPPAPVPTHDPVTGRKRRACSICRVPGHTAKRCPGIPAGEPAPENNCNHMEDGDWHPFVEGQCDRPAPMTDRVNEGIAAARAQEQIKGSGSAPDATDQAASPWCLKLHVGDCGWTAEHPDAPGQWVCATTGKPGKQAYDAGKTRMTAQGPAYGHPDGERIQHLAPTMNAPAATTLGGEPFTPPPASTPVWPEQPPDMVLWTIKQTTDPQVLLGYRESQILANTWGPAHEEAGRARYQTLVTPPS